MILPVELSQENQCLKMATQKEIANHLDMSDRNLREVLAKLKIKSSKESLDNIRITYIRHLREQAAGRGGDNQVKLTSARAQQAISDARLKDLTYFEKVGALVSVEAIEPMLESWAVNARSEIQYAIEKVVTAIQSQHNIEINQELIDNEFANAFRTIGGYPQNFDDSNDEGGE